MRFAYDPELAGDVAASVVPAVTPIPGGMPGGVAPRHVEFRFVKFVGAGKFNIAPRILVYPIEAFVALLEFVGEDVMRLDQLLSERPRTADGPLPYLPSAGAGQVFHARLGYLDFQDGAGIRYLTQFAQNVTVINNEEILYTFQGLTEDGQHYVVAIFPIATAGLPRDFETGRADLPADYNQNYRGYLDGVARELEELSASDFEPDLGRLDAMLQSLVIGPPPEAAEASILEFAGVLIL